MESAYREVDIHLPVCLSFLFSQDCQMPNFRANDEPGGTRVTATAQTFSQFAHVHGTGASAQRNLVLAIRPDVIEHCKGRALCGAVTDNRGQVLGCVDHRYSVAKDGTDLRGVFQVPL